MYDPEANIPSSKRRKKAEEDDPFAEFELEPTIKPTKLVGSQPTLAPKEGQKQEEKSARLGIMESTDEAWEEWDS